MKILKNIADFYRTHMASLLIIFITCTLISGFVNNFESFYGTTYCLVTTGSPSKCIESMPDFCTDIRGGKYGWCADPDYNGPLIGNRNGPLEIGAKCDNWIWNPKLCPPANCNSIDKVQPQIWGWCADPDKNYAMLGTVCGPNKSEGNCNNWIWNPNQCPLSCPSKITIAPSTQDEHCGNVCGNINGIEIPCPPVCLQTGADCGDVCGNVDGKWIDCPPKPCTAPDQCKC